MSSVSLKEILEILKIDSKVQNTDKIQIQGISSLKNGKEDFIGFLNSPVYLKYLKSTEIKYILVSKDIGIKDSRFLYCEDPSKAVEILCDLFYKDKKEFVASIDDTAVIGENCTISTEVSIGPYVIIGNHVTIKDNVVIQGQTYIADHTVIEEGSMIYPQVYIGEESIIGKNCIIHSGARVGSDGFGYNSSDKGHKKISQLGNVILENNVEIGANSCVDCGRFESTIVGEGTKIDNLVQIGHNVIIGKNCLLCGKASIAGSTSLGDFVIVGGESKINGHIEIASHTKISANTFVTSDVEESGMILYGYPATDKKTFSRRIFAYKKIERLENEIESLNAYIKKDIK